MRRERCPVCGWQSLPRVIDGILRCNLCSRPIRVVERAGGPLVRKGELTRALQDLQDSRPERRLAAAQVLADLEGQDREAREGLIAAARVHPDSEVRILALQALAASDDWRAAEAVVDLRLDPNQKVAEVASGLARSREMPSRLSRIVDELAAGDSDGRRAAIGEVRSLPQLRVVVDALVGALDDSEQEIRALALQRLTENRRMAGARARRLLSDHRPGVRAGACLALASLGAPARPSPCLEPPPTRMSAFDPGPLMV
jgi:hypothetical protein